MLDFLKEVLGETAFMPHGHCYMWEPALLWLQVSTNAVIALSYLAISFTLAWLVKRGRGSVPFKGTALAFGTFIIACGFTHLFDVIVIWRPIYWIDGAVRGVTAVASLIVAIYLPRLVPQALDVAKGAQAARQRGIKLQSVVEDLELMVARTKELEQLKSQFFANVSHELRTPLALVLGPAQRLLAAEELDEAQRRDLELIENNGRILLKHVDDLLEASRLEAGKVAPTYAEADLAPLVRRTASNFEGLAESRRLSFSVEAPEALPAQVDPDQVERVVTNLLSNAFKFTPAGGRVSCSLAAAGADARLVVSDTGPGVPLDQREVVFERFRQAEGGATRRFGGTGLGLAIVKDLVDLHGGRVSIDDAPGGGARFEVLLPLRAPAGTEVRAEAEPAEREAEVETARLALAQLQAHVAAAEAHADAAPRAQHVLVVEDNPDMNRFVAETLAAAGYRVTRALDGQQGLEAAAREVPDLVLSDIMMPGLSGDQLVAALRERPALDHVPIVLLTAKADDELRVRLLQEGAQDYLPKPFSAPELLARVANLVTMKRARDVLQAEIEVQMRDLEGLAAEVAHRKRDLQTALESMRVAREAAERASQLKSDFLNMVSHELRTPLTTLQLQLERLRRDPKAELAPDQHRLVDRMSGSARRLGGLIEGLLHYARVERQGIEVQVEGCDPRQVSQEALDEVRPLAQDREELALSLEVEGEPPPLSTDPRLLRLILVNLLGNAVKFTEEGSVRLTLSHTPEGHRFAVTDTGPGIPPEQRARIFEPFEQGEAIQHKHLPGVGLGLTLVREMTRALGGTLELDSEVGRGSTFAVLVPSFAAEGGEGAA